MKKVQIRLELTLEMEVDDSVKCRDAADSATSKLEEINDFNVIGCNVLFSRELVRTAWKH